MWNTVLCVKCGIFKSYLLFDSFFALRHCFCVEGRNFLFSGKLSLSVLQEKRLCIISFSIAEKVTNEFCGLGVQHLIDEEEKTERYNFLSQHSVGMKTLTNKIKQIPLSR